MMKINKTCDQCRHRKIRCIVTHTVPGKPPVCVYCEKRNEPCHFSIFRRRATAKVARPFPEVASQTLKVGPGELLIDRILEQGFQDVPDTPAEDLGYVIKAKEEQTTCSPLAFFSDQRVTSLCEKIGSYRLQSVVERLEEVIVARIRATQGSPWAPIRFTKPSSAIQFSAEEARQYIEAYFKNIHPVYPFLERQEFEQKAYGPDLPVMLENNPAFSALYHAVLALGAQYFHGAPFEPGASKAWRIFEISLGHVNELMLPGLNLEAVQALVAIAIFCQNMGGLQLDDIMIWHAARAALITRAYKMDVDAKTARTFWVIYALEKQLCLEGHIVSTIPDEHVGCVIPNTPECMFGTFNWFLSSIRCARITSIAYPALFSVTASLGDVESRLTAIANIRRRIEEWRLWVPPEFRPGEAPHINNIPDHASKLVLLYSHFWYYNLVITLERLTLKLDKDGARCQQSRQTLMHTARSIAEMTPFIELDCHMPIFILAVTPLSALFILFDFIIHNPRHYETRSNLAALDSITGYFSLLECASKSALFPAGTIIAEFAEIAREYYVKMQTTPVSSMGAMKPVKTRPVDPTLSAVPKEDESMEQLSAPSGPDDAGGSSGGTPSEGTSDYLVYPTPHNFGAATDIQMYDSAGFNKSLFGWMVPDWAEGGFDLAAMNLDSGGGSDVIDFTGNPTTGMQ